MTFLALIADLEKITKFYPYLSIRIIVLSKGT